MVHFVRAELVRAIRVDHRVGGVGQVKLKGGVPDSQNGGNQQKDLVMLKKSLASFSGT